MVFRTAKPPELNSCPVPGSNQRHPACQAADQGTFASDVEVLKQGKDDCMKSATKTITITTTPIGQG